jgi:hypothetical protein
MLQLHLCNYSKWPSYEIPFTSCWNKAFFKQPINSSDTIYRTLDAFPHKYSKISLTQLACLHMSLKVGLQARTIEHRQPKKLSPYLSLIYLCLTASPVAFIWRKKQTSRPLSKLRTEVSSWPLDLKLLNLYHFSRPTLNPTMTQRKHIFHL